MLVSFDTPFRTPARMGSLSGIACRFACLMLALSNMKTLYLRNVPDEVVGRLQRLAEADATSVGAVAVRELTEVSRRADNPALLGMLPDLSVDVTTIVEDLDSERSGR